MKGNVRERKLAQRTHVENIKSKDKLIRSHERCGNEEGPLIKQGDRKWEEDDEEEKKEEEVNWRLQNVFRERLNAKACLMKLVVSSYTSSDK